MSLANPRYIHHLAKEKFLDDPSFVAYLDYLQYWREPAYARFLHYPHALYFLGQLQRPEFRKAMAKRGHIVGAADEDPEEMEKQLMEAIGVIN